MEVTREDVEVTQDDIVVLENEEEHFFVGVGGTEVGCNDDKDGVHSGDRGTLEYWRKIRYRKGPLIYVWFVQCV